VGGVNRPWPGEQLESILQRYISQGYNRMASAIPPKGSMVRLRIDKLMARRGITAYALSQGAKLSYPSAYRLSRPGGRFGRLHADTLDRLCRFFQVQPGALMEWVPKK
jgi:DNA-binding Xre family transcriptional regulator